MDLQDNEHTRNIRCTKANSRLLGHMPEGCRLCIKGLKSVLFLTGRCGRECFYCPLSDQRKDSDGVWINETKASCDNDIISEIEKCGSKGAGITGGEPLSDIGRFCRYVRMLKERFGKGFHIHAYTSRTDLSKDDIKAMDDAGLDALRFHIFGISSLKRISSFPKDNLRLAIEIPVIPGKEETTKRLIRASDSIVDYINLNELEFSDTNFDRMSERGLSIRSEDDYAVQGSREMAETLMEYAGTCCNDLSVHFCTASTKYDFQYWNRMRRRAENISRPWEVITKQGLIKKGIINEDLGTIKDIVKEKYNDTGSRIETSVKNARKAAKKGHDAAIAYQIPIEEPFDFELIPLDRRGKEVE